MLSQDPLLFATIVGGPRNRQNLADRLDAEGFSRLINEHDHFFRRRSRSAAAKKADAFRRMSLAWQSSLISCFSAFISARSDWVKPSRVLSSTACFLIQSRSLSGLHPIFDDIDLRHSDRVLQSASFSSTRRTARARTSSEKRFPQFPCSMAYLPSFLLSDKPRLLGHNQRPLQGRGHRAQGPVARQKGCRICHARLGSLVQHRTSIWTLRIHLTTAS